MLTIYSEIRNKFCNTIFSSLVALLVFAYSGISAASFEAYPGTYPAKLVSVEAANVVHVNALVWSGFDKTFRVTLPGIVIPEDSSDASACQRELIRKGREFTEKFVTEAKELKVHSLWMENTAQGDAESKITTEKGSLINALKKEGFARPASVDPKKPWC